jgi:hypothetical protein
MDADAKPRYGPHMNRDWYNGFWTGLLILGLLVILQRHLH